MTILNNELSKMDARVNAAIKEELDERELAKKALVKTIHVIEFHEKIGVLEKTVAQKLRDNLKVYIDKPVLEQRIAIGNIKSYMSICLDIPIMID